MTAEVANLRQKLEGIEKAAIKKYLEHFYETAKHDGLDLYCRKCSIKLSLEDHGSAQVDLPSLRDEFLPEEPSASTEEAIKDSIEKVGRINKNSV